MRIGSQRNLLTIQRQVQLGVTEINEAIMVWQDWRPDVFCEVTVKRGKEQFDPGTKQRFSEEVWHFRTRYDEVTGIDSTMQILHEGQTFNIRSALPDGQMHSDCVIECTVRDGTLQNKPLSIGITEKIRKAKVGAAYDGFTVKVTGGVAPFVIGVSAGVLPDGISIDATTGVVSGVPNVAGTYTIVATVTDSVGETTSLPAFNIVVEAA